MQHNWKYTGTDNHKGADWYKCTKCGKEDWIASYGELYQLMPKECIIMQNNKDKEKGGRRVTTV